MSFISAQPFNDLIDEFILTYLVKYSVVSEFLYASDPETISPQNLKSAQGRYFLKKRTLGFAPSLSASASFMTSGDLSVVVDITAAADDFVFGLDGSQEPAGSGFWIFLYVLRLCKPNEQGKYVFRW